MFSPLYKYTCTPVRDYVFRRNHYQRLISRSLSTVYALSSGQGKCGVAVMRVTGDNAKEVFKSMTAPSLLPKPRVATLRRIIHPVTGQPLDRGLVLWFPGPHSFTGEDSCELHIHGGSAVINAVLESLSILPGYQPAQPGDFTKRAFYNGKLDLTSVEGLGDLIHAETEVQRKQALQQMEGSLGHLYSKWRQVLLHCRANIEAFIDFSEDENIEEGVIEDVETRIREVIREMKNHLSDNRRGERLRSGLKLAILGRPNVGKSSFLNALVQRPAAIVSHIPGTTRDVVETTLDLGGYPIILSDTAGLRETDDIIESEGIRRAIEKSREADIAVIIIEAKEVLRVIKDNVFEWSDYLDSYFTNIGIDTRGQVSDDDDAYSWIRSQNFITLINKTDLLESETDRVLLESALKESGQLISLKTKAGLDDAICSLKEMCASLCQVGPSENPTLTAARHRIHITSCLESLKAILGSDVELSSLSIRATRTSNTILSNNIFSTNSRLETGLQFQSSDSNSKGFTSNLPLEKSENLLNSEETLLIAAFHLQKATNHLGYVTGHITTEDVLDHIFSAFCIGK